MSQNNQSIILMPKFQLALKKRDFDKKIRERGLDYYTSGMVEKVYNVNSEFYAKINGYRVILGSNSTYCSCPYYENCNDYCKHLYALLLQIKHGDIPDNLINDVKSMTKKQLIDILIKIVDRCAMKSMMIVKIMNDPDNDDTSDDEKSES